MFPPPPPRHGWGRPPRRGCMGCGCLPFVVLALGSMGALLMWLVF